MARVVSASNERVVSFDDEREIAWTLGTCAPGEEPVLWQPISGPVTVAAAWRELGRLDIDDPSTVQALDDNDHWFRASVPDGVGVDGPSDVVGRVTRMLEFDGLATIVEVWLNGVRLATSTSMFVPVRVDVTDAWRAEGNIVELRCLALTSWLDATRWPRPRWRTKLVPEQRLRNVRTTLLGRIPSWSPPVPPVGPWRAARLRVCAGQRVQFVQVAGNPAADLPMWWPWTHGPAVIGRPEARMLTQDDQAVTFRLHTIGHRTIEVDRGPDGDEFHVVVNGERIFCRGAVWMPIDPISARSTPEQVRARLVLARDAGFNMLRISGTTWYEEPHFYDLCDELGILVWQDIALANMDPSTDEAYLQQLHDEIRSNLPNGPSLAIVCGSSETEQQATMVGLDPAVLDTLPMRTHFPGWVVSAAPGVPYMPSTPTGGHLPFSVDTGVGHYYGVGAYLRPLTDARHARVEFAPECLAFANVPRPAAVAALLHDGEVAPTHPRWKARVPRDRGVGWDFEDVRDHYVRVLFGMDPTMLRWSDPVRALTVGRAATAEVMARTFAEWRRAGSDCGGALIWCLNDLWAGAGWGIIDSDGYAKSPVGALAPVLAPVALFAVDEGVNGVDLWIANDTAETVTATLEVRQYRHGSVVVADGTKTVTVAPRSTQRHRVDAILGRFSDPTGAYRFGPLAHDATAARLVGPSGTVLARALHTPDGVSIDQVPLGLIGTATWVDHECLVLEVAAQRLARFVTVEAGHRRASHDHVHIEPGEPLQITLRYDAARPERSEGVIDPPRRGFVSALNGDAEASFAIPSRPDPADRT